MSIMLYIIGGFLVHLSIPKQKEIIKLEIGACVLWLEKTLEVLYINVQIFYFNILFFIEQYL